MKCRALALLVFLLGAPTIGFAQTVVDRCGSDTEPGGIKNLAQALTEGGRIVLNCPPGTVIRMTTGHTVAAGTTIDGEGKVTLDARGLAMIMFRVPNGSFALERLSVVNVALQRRPVTIGAGSVLTAFGDVSLTEVSIRASENPVSINGNARIINSEFFDNTSVALWISGGEALIERSQFIRNGTGLSLQSGRVHDSLFEQNKDGALRIPLPTGNVSVIKSNFSANTGRGAILLSQHSGRGGSATVSVKRSRFTNNKNTNGGGAITISDTTLPLPDPERVKLLTFPPGRFEFGYNKFQSNVGSNGGAINADLHHTEGLVITGGIFVDNEADGDGGAIAWIGRSVLITHSLFRANRGRKGGALFADFREPGSRWVMANSLVAENIAGTNNGAIEVGPLELSNVTIAKNTGIGFVADVHGSPPDLPVVVNTIISQNSEGNCRGIAASGFRGGNMQFGHRDCPDVPFENPFLDSLYVPVFGSRALFVGDVASCRVFPVSSKDLMFQSRASNNRCALGAFERPPIRRVPPRREH